MKRISRWTVYNAHYWKCFQPLKQCRADILIRGGNWQKSQPFAFFTNCMYFTLCFFFNLINWLIKDIYFFLLNTEYYISCFAENMHICPQKKEGVETLCFLLHLHYSTQRYVYILPFIKTKLGELFRKRIVVSCVYQNQHGELSIK